MTTKKLSEKPTLHAVRELVWLQRKQEDRAGLIRSLTDLAVFRIMNESVDCYLAVCVGSSSLVFVFFFEFILRWPCVVGRMLQSKS